MTARRILLISDFPVEWMPDAPEEIRRLPKQHPLTWLRVFAEELVREPGVELHVAVLRKTFSRDLDFQSGGASFHLRKVAGGWRAPSLFWADTFILRKLVRELKPDVVHAWGSEKGATLAASRLGVPYVATVQGLMQWYSELIPLNAYERFASVIEQFSLPRAPLVSGESRPVVNYLRARYPKMPLEHVEHAPHPRFYAVQREPQTSPLRLLFVGEADYRKGADLLFAAARTLASELPFELVIAGRIHPSLLPEWEALASGPLAGRASLKLQLSPEQVVQELSCATFLVFPTRADTGPIAVKEAAVAGVPVIGTQIGGIPDYVEEGKNGFMIPSGDAAALAEAIRRAAAHPLFSQGKVDAGTLEKMRVYLSARRMKEGFLAAYDQVCR